MDHRSLVLRAMAVLPPVLLLVGCGGGGTSNTPPASTSTTPAVVAVTPGTALTLSDASSDDWSTIGVKILSVALIPQGGTAATAVTVYTAPTPAPVINLVQLDQLSEILGNVTIPAGTYTAAVLSISANAGDVTLVTSADPSSGFPVAGSTAIPTAQIQIQTRNQGATGTVAGGNLAVPVTVKLASNLVVTAGGTNALDLEFDLAHPAFIVEHLAASDTTPFWAVNFNGPLHHHPCAVNNLVLRHLYGTPSAVTTDGSAINFTKEFPAWPIASPETATGTTQAMSVLADATNGTLVYDLDAKTTSTLTSFSSLAATISGRQIRTAARYQSNGTLVAARLWIGNVFNTVFVSPEGHVLHVNAAATPPTFTVENEAGVGVPVQVNAATEFFFRTPAAALADATPISGANGGITFLTAKNLVRGFKVHASVDPTTTPMTATTVDIEIAKYDGALTAVPSPDFTTTHAFATAADDYAKSLGLINTASANGTDPTSGAAIAGFKWWDLGYPVSSLTVDPTGSGFLGAMGGAVTFGGTGSAGAMVPVGVTYTTWNDPAQPSAWSAKFSILEPTQLPRGTVSTAWALTNGATSGTFGLKLAGGPNVVPVSLNVTSGSAALVYQVDRSGGVVTVTPVDITTAAGQASLATNLVSPNAVMVYGIPQAAGTIKGYVVFYYTGTQPA